MLVLALFLAAAASAERTTENASVTVKGSELKGESAGDELGTHDQETNWGQTTEEVDESRQLSGLFGLGGFVKHVLPWKKKNDDDMWYDAQEENHDYNNLEEKLFQLDSVVKEVENHCEKVMEYVKGKFKQEEFGVRRFEDNQFKCKTGHGPAAIKITFEDGIQFYGLMCVDKDGKANFPGCSTNPDENGKSIVWQCVHASDEVKSTGIISRYSYDPSYRYHGDSHSCKKNEGRKECQGAAREAKAMIEMTRKVMEANPNLGEIMPISSAYDVKKMDKKA